jgi:hypothetical protein
MVTKAPFVRILATALFFAFIAQQTGSGRAAVTAPSLPAPSGAIVKVASEAALQDAVSHLGSNTTILIAAGTYRLSRTLWINGQFNNVALRGATDNSDDVVLVGPGMSHASYGDVPYGIWTGGGVQGVEISNLTVRDIYNHAIMFASGTQRPHVYNVHLIDAGAAFIESRADQGPAVDNGIVEYSTIEYTDTGRVSSTGGVDVHRGASWIIRHNVLRNIVGPSWQLAGPAIAAWDGAHDTIAEGNSIVNCSTGIAFGLLDRGGTDHRDGIVRNNTAGMALGVLDRSGSDHRGGIVRNNMIFRSGAASGGPGIVVADSANTQVLNNTVFLSHTYGSPIEYRYAGAHNVIVVNNLFDGVVWARDGATGVEDHNLAGATADLFAGALAGDLHLSPTAASAIDRGLTVPNVLEDLDGKPRPNGNAFDIGADEYVPVVPISRTMAAPVRALTISGRVLTASGNLTGVTVTLSGSQAQSMTTTSSGKYSFSGVASGGNYTVSASRSGYTFTPNNFTYFNVTADKSGDFVGGTGTVPVTPVTPSAPAIQLTSPTSGSTFIAPANITISASASAAAGVKKIDFFNGSILIATSTSATASVAWNNVAVGSYAVKAVVTDTQGATATSAQSSVTVSTSGSVSVAPSVLPSPTGDPTTWPLVQAGNLAYVGAFQLPSGTYGNAPSDSGGMSFDLAVAYGLAFNPNGNGGAGSLFLSSKENLLNVAEVNIPAPVNGALDSLNTAGVLQGFSDPSEGRFTGLGVNRIGGLLVTGNQLVFDGYVFYDGLNTQVQSHFKRSTNLSMSGSVQGAYGNSYTTTAGMVDGYMTPIPSAWQSKLGGTALTGNADLSIIGRTSWGPGVFAFTPESLTTNFLAQPMVYYTMEHPTLGNGTPTTANTALFNLADTIHGVAMPDGTRSVLFFGTHGMGAWCYGEGTSDPTLDHVRSPDGEIYCYDPDRGAKGQHAYPYQHFVWAYDANDFAAVKAGTKQPWDVVPYATWSLNIPSTGIFEIAGVAYDPSRRLLYVAEEGRVQVGCCTFIPIIHAFQLQ